MGDDGSNRTLLDDSSSCEHLGSTNSEGLENYSELDSTSASFDSGSEDLATILKQKNTLFTLPIFFISTFRATTLNVLLQYTSIRYGWKLSRVWTYTQKLIYLANSSILDKRVDLRGCWSEPNRVSCRYSDTHKVLTDHIPHQPTEN